MNDLTIPLPVNKENDVLFKPSSLWASFSCFCAYYNTLYKKVKGFPKGFLKYIQIIQNKFIDHSIPFDNLHPLIFALSHPFAIAVNHNRFGG